MTNVGIRARLRKKLAQRKALIRKQADIITGDEISTGAAFYLQNQYLEIGHSLDLLEKEIEEIKGQLQ
jgi:hypothetical protein